MIPVGRSGGTKELIASEVVMCVAGSCTEMGESEDSRTYGMEVFKKCKSHKVMSGRDEGCGVRS
jgi:hypothetical protein